MEDAFADLADFSKLVDDVVEYDKTRVWRLTLNMFTSSFNDVRTPPLFLSLSLSLPASLPPFLSPSPPRRDLQDTKKHKQLIIIQIAVIVC